jgi:pectate lyase
MRSSSRAARGVPALSLALLLGAMTMPSGTAAEEPPAPWAETSPTGFAAVDALGRNGTTGGAGGPTVTAATTEQFLEYIDTTGPLVIRVQGTIDVTSKQGVRPDKTIVGVGSSAVVNGGGLDFYRSHNVIVRNIRFTGAEDDAVNVGQESHHIWIDHNEFVAPVDGAVDIVRGSQYVTVSWNWFNKTDKSMLLGHSDANSGQDTGKLKVSIHHNFFDSVPHPCYSASGYDESRPGRLVQRDNVFAGAGAGACETNGIVTEPRTYYAYTLDPATDVPSLVRAGAGVGKIGT